MKLLNSRTGWILVILYAIFFVYIVGLYVRCVTPHYNPLCSLGLFIDGMPASFIMSDLHSRVMMMRYGYYNSFDLTITNTSIIFLINIAFIYTIGFGIGALFNFFKRKK